MDIKTKNLWMMGGDCLERMKEIPENSVDMILCDLPYGTTKNKWDVIIPFDKLWEQYLRVCKGAIVLHSAQPFTSLLVTSNLKNFKYAWVWDKASSTGFLNAKKQPLRRTEDILVFSYQKGKYNPIMDVRGKPRKKGGYIKGTGTENYGDFKSVTSVSNEYYPTNLLTVSNANRNGKTHPTQKPVKLAGYLIETYSDEGDTILDNCMGSGTTGVACVNKGRKFIGIELDDKYFPAACDRILKAAKG